MSLLYKVIYSNTAWLSYIFVYVGMYYIWNVKVPWKMCYERIPCHFLQCLSALVWRAILGTRTATPCCDFRRRNFMEQLSMLIHQVEIYSTKDIDSWRRLRLCLQEMGAPYYKGMIQYNGFIVLSSILFNIIVALLTMLKVQPVTSGKISFSYICIPLVYFNLLFNFGY